MAVWDTVATLLPAVSTELGLGALTASYTSTDVNVLRLQALVAVVGRKLVKQHPWLQQKIEYTFTTGSTTTYAMPDGVESLLDGTAWNRTTNERLYFASPREWQQLKALDTTVFPGVEVVHLVRVSSTHALTMEFPAATTAGETIAFEYWGRLWVRPNAGPPYLDAPTATTDTVAIDNLLFTRALKLAFKLDLGLPSDAAQNEFDEVLATVRNTNALAAEVLAVGGGLSFRLGHPTIPETGYGV